MLPLKALNTQSIFFYSLLAILEKHQKLHLTRTACWALSSAPYRGSNPFRNHCPQDSDTQTQDVGQLGQDQTMSKGILDFPPSTRPMCSQNLSLSCRKWVSHVEVLPRGHSLPWCGSNRCCGHVHPQAWGLAKLETGQPHSVLKWAQARQSQPREALHRPSLRVAAALNTTGGKKKKTGDSTIKWITTSMNGHFSVISKKNKFFNK